MRNLWFDKWNKCLREMWHSQGECLWQKYVIGKVKLVEGKLWSWRQVTSLCFRLDGVYEQECCLYLSPKVKDKTWSTLMYPVKSEYLILNINFFHTRCTSGKVIMRSQIPSLGKPTFFFSHLGRNWIKLSFVQINIPCGPQLFVKKTKCCDLF